MPVEATIMETAQPFDRLRLALVGEEKSGKSRLAATARKPILFMEFDGRREAIAGKKDVYCLSFRDERWPKQPAAFNEMLTYLTRIESGETLDTLIGNGAPKVRPKTLVWDSIQTIAKSAFDYGLYTNKDLRREISIADMKVFLSKGWDGRNAEMSLVESLILRGLGIQDTDNIVILHETNEEAPGSTSEKRTYTGRIGVFPVRYKLLLKYFNEVWRLTRTSDVPQIQVIPDYRFTAATNLDFSKIPASEMRPDIEYLISRALSNGVSK